MPIYILEIYEMVSVSNKHVLIVPIAMKSRTRAQLRLIDSDLSSVRLIFLTVDNEVYTNSLKALTLQANQTKHALHKCLFLA